MKKRLPVANSTDARTWGKTNTTAKKHTLPSTQCNCDVRRKCACRNITVFFVLRFALLNTRSYIHFTVNMLRII